MNNFVKLNDDEKIVVFSRTAEKMKLKPFIIEKDFWVCFMLDHLFNDSKFKNLFVFKGGTSLSKSYNLIERFSEDIDLILDWNKIIDQSSNPWEERSHTRQDKYNKEINEQASLFYQNEFIPELNNELKLKLGKGEWTSIDDLDWMVINFKYPRYFEDEYITPIVRLEIGPLAQWMPSHITKIIPFVSEKYPEIFSKTLTNVLTIDAERTFWEKITILHKMAHFPENKIIQPRYARHLYDVYKIGNSNIKEMAFKRKELLAKDIEFKQKFYYSKNAHYETATLKDVNLIPANHIIEELRKDYKQMQNMIYGDYPDYDTIIEYLKGLEEEIHCL